MNDYPKGKSIEGDKSVKVPPRDSVTFTAMIEKVGGPVLNPSKPEVMTNKSVNVSLRKLVEAGPTIKECVERIPRPIGSKSPMHESGIRKSSSNPSELIPAKEFDFINIFSNNFLEAGMLFKKIDASILHQELTNEEGCDCMSEDDDDSNSAFQPGLDQHFSYQREFILDIKPSQQASGFPNSSERLRQARNLWKARIGGLHEQYERVDENRGAWEAFVLEQPTNYWLLGCFAAIEEPHTMCPGKQHVLSSFAPKSARADWLHDFEQRREAFQMACNTYSVRQTEWIDSMKQRTKYKGTSKSLRQVDGSEVKVSVDSHMTIWCHSDDGQKRGIWITVPRSARPYTWLDKRTVHFSKYGIDVRDESYSRCLPWARHASVTIPKERFMTAGNKEELIWLWNGVTGLEYGAVDHFLDQDHQLQQSKTASRQHGPTGKPIPPIITPTQVSNPQIYRLLQNDALWLLNEYLDFYFPDGGDFWTGSKEDFPHGSGDVERFSS